MLCLCILLIGNGGFGVILILCFHLGRCLREVDKERLLALLLPLPLIKSIGQDDTALSFHQGILWLQNKLIRD